MHFVLGTMMPEICEAPHFPVFSRHLPLCSGFNGGRRSSHSLYIRLSVDYDLRIMRR